MFVGRDCAKIFRVTAKTTPKQVSVLDRPLSTSPHAKTILFLYDSIDFASVLDGNAPSWTTTDFGAIVAKRGPELRR